MPDEKLSDLIKYKPDALNLLEAVCKRAQDRVLTLAREKCLAENRASVTKADILSVIRICPDLDYFIDPED